MNALKKMFSKKTEDKCTLTINEIVHKDIEVILNDKGVLFSGVIDLIPFTDISDLSLEEKTISFFNKNTKLKMETEKANEFYEKLTVIVKDKTIFDSKNNLYYVYNVIKRKFELHERKADIRIKEDSGFFLKITDELKLLHYEQISTKTQYYLDKNSKGFVWSVFNQGSFHTFSIEFYDNLDFLDFCSKYVECLYKSVNEEGNFGYFKDISTVSFDTPQPSSESETIEEDADKWNQFVPQEPTKNEFNSDSKVNGMLIMGNDQVFVSRGSSLGVFSTTKEDLEFRTHIKNTLNDPQKILTYNQDQNLLIVDKDSRNQMQLLDLNRGEIIEKWDVKTDMNDFFNSRKDSNQQTLIGLSDYSLFRVDPRTKDKVVDKNEYKTKNEFSCGLSTSRGDVAVASKKGDLRLYNKIDKRAKSLLPGFGDEVQGIDSSRDGSMILCTYQNYILLYLVGTDYSKPLGKEKPTPKRLQLKPQHLSLISSEVNFTEAKFDREDSLIVTSTGRFVIKWDVKDVLKGNVYNYSIKALYDVIVDENFVMNGNEIVVALPNDVKKVTDKDLKNPN